MEYDVRLEQAPSRPLAVVRPSCPAAGSVEDRAGRLWGCVESCPVQQVPGAGRHVAVYLDREINLEEVLS